MLNRRGITVKGLSAESRPGVKSVRRCASSRILRRPHNFKLLADTVLVAVIIQNDSVIGQHNPPHRPKKSISFLDHTATLHPDWGIRAIPDNRPVHRQGHEGPVVACEP